MFRKVVILAYKVRFRLLLLNLKFDKLKTPVRCLLTGILVSIYLCGILSENYTIRSISIIYFIVLLVTRMYWFSWAKKYLGGGKK